MKTENLSKYKTFRNFCNTNAEVALHSAQLLINQNANHIIFHLSVLALEEIGKIFICFQNLSVNENIDGEKSKIPIDDHVKKLFWAIWGPSFMEEKITKQQLDSNKDMATKLHDRRLDVLYTDLLDNCTLSEKITDEEAIGCFRFAKARLEISKVEGEIEENDNAQIEMAWFMEATDNKIKRAFIFSDESQKKLIEFANVREWIFWLKNHFEIEEKQLKELLQKELKRSFDAGKDKVVPKWKMKFKIISQSHSIRQNVLNSFNQKFKGLELSKGGDNHTLIIEITFGNYITADGLWHHGLVFSKLFVSALNIATNGLFYWNIIVDTDKYYERVFDIENKQQLSAKLPNAFKINWEEKQLVLTEDHLVVTKIMFEYFSSIYNTSDFEPINYYITALGMFAKTDIHLALEKESFDFYYKSFITALKANEVFKPEENIKEVGYRQIEGMLKGREEYDKVMDLANDMTDKNENAYQSVTLTEVIGIKMYAGKYLLTLAIRKLNNDKTLRLSME